MKKVGICFLIVLGFSCSNSRVHVDKNERLACKVYECFNEHDWSGMAECYSDPVLFLDPSFGSSWIRQTHKDIIQKYTQLHKAAPDISDSISAVYSDGAGHVIVEFVSQGTTPRGEKWRLPICTVFTIENGKIVKDATYYDN